MKKETFNWHSATLQKSTIITNDFKLTQNVRRFFSTELEKEVHFNRKFMSWMHDNPGTTLGDALQHYKNQNSF